MRHKKDHRRLGVNKDQRKALLRGLCINLAEHGYINTTVARAKEVRRMFEKLITLGKKGDLSSRRLALQKVPNTKAIGKIFDKYALMYKSRQGGYTRILKLDNRLGDNAPMARIALVEQAATGSTDENKKDKSPVKSSPNQQDSAVNNKEVSATEKPIIEKLKEDLVDETKEAEPTKK